MSSKDRWNENTHTQVGVQNTPSNTAVISIFRERQRQRQEEESRWAPWNIIITVLTFFVLFWFDNHLSVQIRSYLIPIYSMCTSWSGPKHTFCLKGWKEKKTKELQVIPGRRSRNEGLKTFLFVLKDPCYIAADRSLQHGTHGLWTKDQILWLSIWSW